MPKTPAKPRRTPPAPPPVEELVIDQAEELEELPGQEEELSPLEQLLQGLAGGAKYAATVYRAASDGEPENYVGKLELRPDAEYEWLLEKLREQWGGGVYRIQVRQVGQRGTAGNASSIRIEGQPKGASSPATAASHDPVRELMVNQNRELMGLVRELAGKAATPPTGAAAPSIESALNQFGSMFKFAKALSRDQASPAMPPWLEQLGQIAGPFMATIAGGFARATRPATPALPGRLPQRPSPAPPAGLPAAGTAAEPSPPAADDEDQAAQVLETILTAAARSKSPDVATYTRILFDAAGDQLGAALELLPVGGLAARALEQIPDLAKHGDFAHRVELELRRLVLPPAATPPNPQNGGSDAPG